MVVGVSVVPPHDPRADRELSLLLLFSIIRERHTACYQHGER